jgi:hemophore-related protein
MRLNASTVRRGLVEVFAASALGAAAAVTIAVPTANAAPAQCTAAGLASTVSRVTGDAAGYLNDHPDANDAITNAGQQSTGDAESSLRAYFATHQDQYGALKGIAAPLTALRQQCNATVSAGQVSALLQAFAA